MARVVMGSSIASGSHVLLELNDDLQAALARGDECVGSPASRLPSCFQCDDSV